MRLQKVIGYLGLLSRLATSPAIASGETVDPPRAAPIESEPPVIQHDLSGPRLGATIAPDGTTRSQFGWHFEHQAASSTRGPWFVVETVLLAGGVESQLFIPNGTMVFGLRLPSGFEFGLGPSVTLGGRNFMRSALVAAAGRSFNLGGIRVPVNVAVAADRDGPRFTFVTGWAIRDRNEPPQDSGTRSTYSARPHSSI